MAMGWACKEMNQFLRAGLIGLQCLGRHRQRSQQHAGLALTSTVITGIWLPNTAAPELVACCRAPSLREGSRARAALWASGSPACCRRCACRCSHGGSEGSAREAILQMKRTGRWIQWTGGPAGRLCISALLKVNTAVHACPTMPTAATIWLAPAAAHPWAATARFTHQSLQPGPYPSLLLQAHLVSRRAAA